MFRAERIRWLVLVRMLRSNLKLNFQNFQIRCRSASDLCARSTRDSQLCSYIRCLDSCSVRVLLPVPLGRTGRILADKVCGKQILILLTQTPEFVGLDGMLPLVVAVAVREVVVPTEVEVVAADTGRCPTT